MKGVPVKWGETVMTKMFRMRGKYRSEPMRAVFSF